MAENTSQDLKKILFDTLNGLVDKTIDVATAKAISDTAQTILNAAKVEMEFARMCEKNPENWLTSAVVEDSSFPAPSRKGISHPKPGVTVHRIT